MGSLELWPDLKKWTGTQDRLATVEKAQGLCNLQEHGARSSGSEEGCRSCGMWVEAEDMLLGNVSVKNELVLHSLHPNFGTMGISLAL